MSEDKNVEDYPTYEQAGGNKAWDEMTELEKAYYDIRKLKNALAVNKNTIQRLRAAASPVSDAGWISVTDDKKPDTGLRVEIFSPMYPVGDPMRHRIIDEQFLSISKDATHWRYLSEPFAISTPTNVQEQDELWEEVEDVFLSNGMSNERASNS